MATITTKAIDLSPDQLHAAGKIRGWLAGERDELIFAGLAGTGKSTVLAALHDEMRAARCLYMTPSAKAAYVLRTKGVPAVTLHSAIYLFGGTHERPDGKEVPIFNEREGLSDSLPYQPDRFVIDEASMVNDTDYCEVRSKGLPTLWVGDHGQLPPVGGDPEIMKRPHVALEKIHRQAGDSGIIRMAHDIRSGGSPGKRHESHDVEVRSLGHPRLLAQFAVHHGYDQVICAFNATRHMTNKAMRFALKKKGMLDVGDKVICRFNNRREGVHNGMQCIVDEILSEDEISYTCNLRVDLGGVEKGQWRRNIRMQKISLGNPEYVSSMRAEHCCEFDYGYTITAHSGQGSSYGRTLVAYQPCRNWSMARWGYTAVTRAESHLCVMV